MTLPSWIRAALRFASREARHSIRRVGPYMASITLGVTALVSIHSFQVDVERAVEREAEVLMGANARLNGDGPWSDTVQALRDSLASAGRRTARVTSVPSMVLAPSSDIVRLIQVRAIDAGYPFYGSVRSVPEGAWGAHLEEGRALVDPAVLPQLEVAVGDTIIVGNASLEIAGTVDDLPTDLAFQTAVGPRIHVSHETLDRAQLLGFGSLARYELFFEIPDVDERQALDERYDDMFGEMRLRFTLAEQQARRLSNGVEFLGRFLGLVGLGALLLGGVGVASAIHVYVQEKRASVAVLRCLGARQRVTFLVYLLQAAGLGALGAAAGVILGVALQRLLPVVLAPVLPVPVTPSFSPGSALAGLGVGVWVALAFAFLPLLKIRDVTPLQALRADVEPARTSRWLRGLVVGCVATSVVVLCVLEAPETDVGLGFAAGLAVTVGALWLVAWGLVAVTRRVIPPGLPYPVRQGVSNLFRPRNQTVSVTLALGLGTFVIALLLQVEGSVRRDLTLTFGEDRPNLLLFDIQPDQIAGVRDLLPGDARDDAEVSPLVSARIASINGVGPDALRERDEGEGRPEGWALRREYRNTYRAELGGAEELVAGRWWDGTPGTEDDTAVASGELPGVSLEVDVAESLGVSLGDTVTWNVSGVDVPSVVTSLRRVDWERLEPNFFAVLEPGSLDGAPQTALMLARMPDAEARAAVQRDLVRAFPNVSALDVSRVQEAIESVLDLVRRALAFLGGFAALAGGVVLVATLATSRTQRKREGALLRTLGARRSQVRTVLLAEYATLGTLATLAGIILGGVAASVLLPSVFEVSYVPPWGTLAAVWGVVTGLTVAIGLAGSRHLLDHAPLPALREASEEA